MTCVSDDVIASLRDDVTASLSEDLIASLSDDVMELSDDVIASLSDDVIVRHVQERRNVVLNILYDSQLDQLGEDLAVTHLTDRWVDESIVFDAGCPLDPYAAGYRETVLKCSFCTLTFGIAK